MQVSARVPTYFDTLLGATNLEGVIEETQPVVAFNFLHVTRALTFRARCAARP